MRLYKWLNGNKPAHGGSGEWDLPKDGKPGKWWRVKGKLEPRRNGLHLCREGDLVIWIAQDLYECERKGGLIDANNKVVARQARLTRRLDGWDEQTARLYACDCAQRALTLAGNPDPSSVKAVWVSRACASGLLDGAALEAARSAARSAAMFAAESVRSAAWSAAESAARSAAESAAKSAWSEELEWQAARLLEYAYHRVDLDEIKARTEKWLEGE